MRERKRNLITKLIELWLSLANVIIINSLSFYVSASSRFSTVIKINLQTGKKHNNLKKVIVVCVLFLVAVSGLKTNQAVFSPLANPTGSNGDAKPW